MNFLEKSLKCVFKAFYSDHNLLFGPPCISQKDHHIKRNHKTQS